MINIRDFITCSLVAIRASERGVRLLGSPSYGVIKYSIGDLIVKKTSPRFEIYDGKHEHAIRLKMLDIYSIESENFMLEAAIIHLNSYYVTVGLLDLLDDLREDYKESYLVVSRHGDETARLAREHGFKYFLVDQQFKDTGMIGFAEHTCSYTLIGDEDDLYQSALYVNMVAGRQIYRPIIKRHLIWE